MSNIASLHGNPIATEVNPELVETLERLLNDARDGKIVALAYTAATRQETYHTGWTDTPDGISLGSGILALMSKFGAASWQ